MTNHKKTQKSHKLLGHKRFIRNANLLSLATIVSGTIATVGMSVGPETIAHAAGNVFETAKNSVTLSSEKGVFSQHNGYTMAKIYGQMGNEPLYLGLFHYKGYMAWCMDYDRRPPQNGTTATSSQETSVNKRRILLNGYPIVSAKALGAQSAGEAAAATNFAIWQDNADYGSKGFNLNKISKTVTGASANGYSKGTPAETARVIAIAKKILKNAAADKRSAAKPKFLMTMVSKKSSGDDYVMTYKTSLTGNYKAKGAKVTAYTMPSGGSAKQGSTTLKKGSAVSVGKDIVVTIPKPKVGATGVKWSLTVNTGTNGYADFKNYFSKGASSTQNVVVQSTVKADTLQLKKTIGGSEQGSSVDKKSFKLVVHKNGDEGTDVSGVRLTLIKVNADGTKTPVQDEVTGSDGTATFDDLPNGNYIVREDHSDQDHDTLLTDSAVTIADSDQYLDLHQTEIKDKPLIRSFATETDSATTKYTRLVDAKPTNVSDELLLDNLDAGHSYKVVDRAYVVDADASASDYEKEMVPLTDTNGTAAESTQTFTQPQVDSDNGADRGSHKVTTSFSNLDLRKLQGKKIVFQATVYRGDDADTHAGQELAKEDTYHDTNQTLEVQKPKITTVATANGDNDAIQPQDDHGNKVTNPYSQTKISDYAHITGLVVGHKYSVHLREKTKDSSGNVVDYTDPSTKKPVTKDYTFTATDPEMDIKTNMPTFSTVDQQQKNLTIYYNITPDDDTSNKLGYEENISDANETIRVTSPEIQTTALIDGDKETNPTKTTSLQDVVKVTDVAPNQPLQLGAIASDDHGKAIIDRINGKNYYLMGKINYNPGDADNGTAYVPLQLVNAPDSDKTSTNGSSTQQPNLDTVSITDKSVRQTMNKLTAIDPSDVSFDPAKAAKTSGGTTDFSNPYTFDTKFLAGKSMTLFEDLWENPDKPMASHADVNDKNQTVTLTNPKIHTEALLNDHHTSNPNRMSRLYDKVYYTDVAPGHEFDVNALAVNPANGHNIVIRDGSTGNDYFNLMGKRTVLPDKETGEVDVPLQEVGATDASVKQAQDAKNSDSTKSGTGDATGNTTKTPTSTDNNAANDKTSGSQNSSSSVAISSSDSDSDIKQAVKDIDVIADKYNVDHTKLDAELSLATKNDETAMTSDQKVYIVNAFNVVATAIKAAQSAAKLNPTSSDSTPIVANSITSDSSDSDIKQACAQLKIVAARYGLKTDALDTALSNAQSPLRKIDRDAIVAAYANLVGNIHDVQDKASAKANSDTASNSKNANHADNGYDTNINTDADAMQRIKDNTLASNDPVHDSTPVDLKDKSYLIDTTALRGVKMVMVEDMSTGIRYSSSDDSRQNLTSEADMNDTNQTVRVTNPKIHTMQTIDNKKSYVINGDDQDVKVPVVDKVSFTDFAPGEKATLTAVEMDAGTKQPVLLEGQYLIGRKTMTPTTSDGTATVNFNEFTNVPATRYTNTMLDSNGLMINRATKAEIEKEQDANYGTDSDANKAAVNGDETNNAQNDGNVDNSYESLTGTGLGTDDVDSETDTSAYDLPLKSLETMSSLADGDKASWVAYETAQGQNGDIIAEHKDATDADQTISITHKTTKDNSNSNGSGGNNINQNGNSNSNGAKSNQHQTNGSNNVTINNGNNGGSSNGAGGTTGTNGNGGTNGTNGGTTGSMTPNTGFPNVTNGGSTANGSGLGRGSRGVGSGSTIPSNSTTPAFGTNNTAPAGNGGQVYNTPNRPGFATTGGNSDVSHNWLYNFIYGIFH